MLLLNKITESGPQSILTAHLFRQSGFGEELKARWEQGSEWVSQRLAEDAWGRLFPREGTRVEGTTGEWGLTGELDENTWRESEFFRDGIKYRPGMTWGQAEGMAEDFDARRYRDLILSQSPGGAVRAVAGFAAMLAPQALDPINYIPIFGAASKVAMVAKFGSVLGRALVHSGEAVALTAAIDPFLIKRLQDAGEQVEWQEMVWDLGAAGLIGGLFGSVAGMRAKRKGEIGGMHRKAVADMIEDGSDGVDVSPVGQTFLEEINADRPDNPLSAVRPEEPPLFSPDQLDAAAKSADNPPRNFDEALLAEAEEHRIDLESGEFAEFQRVEEMKATGDLYKLADDEGNLGAQYDEASRLAREAEADADALMRAMECLRG